MTADPVARRRIAVYALASLDGGVDYPGSYFPEVDRPGAPVFDEVLAGLEAEMIARQDAVLLGRRTYDEWAGYWPHSDEQPFAGFINGVRKLVVTSTPLTTVWENSAAVAGPVGEIVRTLRAEGGGEVGVHGSITLARSLLAEGLVDVIHLAVGHVVDTRGRRLLDGLAGLRVLELERAVPTPSGSLWLSYRLPTVGDEP